MGKTASSRLMHYVKLALSILSALLLVILALAACTPTPPPTPRVTITAPLTNAVIPAPGAVVVTVQVTNFSLAEKLGTAIAAGEGHIHYFLDVTPPTAPGKPAVTETGTYAATAATSYTWQNVKAGQHTLSAELVNNDHTPLNPPVFASVRITVGPATITITTPKHGASIPAGDIPVAVLVSNFSLVDKMVQLNNPDEGHIVYYLDVTPPTTSGAPAIPPPGNIYAATPETTYTFKNVAAGTHTIYAMLVNNDHSPLNPPVMAQIAITTQAAAIPAVSITLPANNATLPPGDINVSIAVTNFNLVSKLGQTNAKGEGHVHYFLDVTPPQTQGQPAVPPAGSIYTATTDTSYTFTNVAAGAHTIYVMLVNNDHTPLSPPVIAQVAINLSSSSGSGSGSGTPQNITISLVAQNFAFDKTTITVSPGANVTINFNNRDSVPHNFAAYTNSSVTTSIFVGQWVNGPATTTYTFKAPATAGSYFFRCDVHPNMTGTLIVQ